MIPYIATALVLVAGAAAYFVMRWYEAEARPQFVGIASLAVCVLLEALAIWAVLWGLLSTAAVMGAAMLALKGTLMLVFAGLVVTAGAVLGLYRSRHGSIFDDLL